MRSKAPERLAAASRPRVSAPRVSAGGSAGRVSAGGSAGGRCSALGGELTRWLCGLHGGQIDTQIEKEIDRDVDSR